MNDLMKFEFEGKAVRTVTNENGMTEWMGKEVAEALGYKNTREAIKYHCKADGVAKRYLIDSQGRKQEAVFINEANLYRLITHSKLASAERFEKWVFETVLPSIRKHGGYIKPTATPEQVENLKAQLHNMAIETKHWQKIAELETMTAEAWKARSEYGAISQNNNLPKMLKRRGAWVADPRFRSSLMHNWDQMTFAIMEGSV